MSTGIDLSDLDLDGLSELIEEAKAARTELRLGNREKVRELKAEMAGLQQRRTSRKGEAASGEKPKKKKKKSKRSE